MKVNEVFKLIPQSGEIGLEIEMEADSGPHFPVEIPGTFWVPTTDGSLRGVSVEYVLAHPINQDDVANHIALLNKAIKDKKTKHKYSFRAGVHVHLNCQKMTMKQVEVFTAVWLTVEELLVEWCGSDRVGNLFCLRNKDARGMVDYLGKIFGGKTYSELNTDTLRYGAINLAALPKYGSIEFRCLSTQPGLANIEQWVDMLLTLKKNSMDISSIHELLERFSMESPEGWVKTVLGDKYYSELRSQDNFDQKVWSGVRNAQDMLIHMV